MITVSTPTADSLLILTLELPHMKDCALQTLALSQYINSPLEHLKSHHEERTQKQNTPQDRVPLRSRENDDASTTHTLDAGYSMRSYEQRRPHHHSHWNTPTLVRFTNSEPMRHGRRQQKGISILACDLAPSRVASSAFKCSRPPRKRSSSWNSE